VNAWTRWEENEFLIFYNPMQDAYHIETTEENQRKPPMADGWRIVARANGWMAAAAVVEQRSKERVDR
jgi:hypothetical protein